MSLRKEIGVKIDNDKAQKQMVALKDTFLEILQKVVSDLQYGDEERRLMKELKLGFPNCEKEINKLQLCIGSEHTWVEQLNSKH